MIPKTWIAINCNILIIYTGTHDRIFDNTQCNTCYGFLRDQIMCRSLLTCFWRVCLHIYNYLYVDLDIKVTRLKTHSKSSTATFRGVLLQFDRWAADQLSKHCMGYLLASRWAFFTLLRYALASHVGTRPDSPYHLSCNLHACPHEKTAITTQLSECLYVLLRVRCSFSTNTNSCIH